ncbi:TonB-dependent receptor [Panacibacter sp. DH6]|uniref:TonB-dependent receptor n=1 Tax=Panacibacter microcysteis TaxID=2793269 RepID=A0A931EAG0_9BACT|nr:TonB-dependent receptor [Panacibacter microcysteis]MBG9377199.1 TonB-dependent receptor [Panacibacter microcysteis]
MSISLPQCLTRKLTRIFQKHRLLYLLMIVFAPMLASAQNQTFTGTVKDETGKPLAGVSVVLKGSSKGTVTNEQGVFTISATAGSTLVLSSVGYDNKEVVLDAQTTLSIALTAGNQRLDDVIVVGYGTQKRTAVTGAISTVNSKTINEIPVVSVQQALQGRVPGVNVVSNGSPGTQPIVTIRGISSISYASNPLYVVDGFPTGDLSTIDTRDIESVDVLKDASAAAIYGSRATNGVIIITTKKGRRDGQMHVNLNSYYGIQNVTERLSLLNPEQFDQYAIAYRGSAVQRRSDPAWVNKPIYQGATATYGNNVTDWQDAYFKQGAMTQTNIGLSGGNEVSRFYASGSFLDQTGTAPTVAYRRYNFRINSDHKISKTFSFGENLYAAYADQDYDNNETGTRSNLVNVIKMMPYMPVYDPTTNGGFRGVNSVLDGGDPTNPIEDAVLKNPGTRSTLKILGTIYAEVNFTSWLKFRSTFGIDYANGLDYRFSPIFNDSGTVAGSSAIQATITNNRAVSSVQLYTEQLTFDKTFGNHHVNAIAVYEYQGQRIKNENASGNQLSNDLKTLNNASNVSVQTLVADYNIISLIGRLSYDYKGKYLFSAALRRDGGSYWAPGNKWQTFPSASVGWRIDQEPFMQNQNKISELKLRAGYGITGLNGAVLGSSPWQVFVNSNSAYYPFGNAATSGPASSIQRLGNKDLEWETTKQINVGLDLGLFSNALTLSAEYYQRKTDNLILAVPLSPSMGYLSSTVITNVAGMQNNGVELQLGYNKRKGDFQWNATANVSFIKNNIYRLAEGVPNIEAGADVDLTLGYNVTNTAIGQPVQSFYGWETEGIFQSEDEVSKHAFQTAGTAAGDIKFKDLNGDGVIDNNDRTFLGSFIPKFTYALNLGANYKGFGLSVFFQGVQGNKIYNALRTTTEGMVRFFNAGTAVLDAWTPTNTNTSVPRAISADPNQNARPSTRFLEDGSYLRLKNIMLSYNVSDKFLRSVTKGAIRNFNIYVSAQNILTFTKYTGYDPEVGNRAPNASSLTNGIDYAVYPQPKGYQVGISTNF